MSFLFPKHYHLSEDIADDAIHWLREQKAFAPDKPFFMYWAPGAAHGPHQVSREWADKYQGTIYELLKISPPSVVNGFAQDPLDGVSMVYSISAPKAPGTHHTQFFDIMASRGVYQDGWFASARGPREPWVCGIPPGIKEWSPLRDTCELYHIDED